MSDDLDSAIHPPAPLRLTVAGWALSLLLTAGAFAAVLGHLLDAHLGIVVALVLAVVQVAVHLVCFVHVGAGRGGRTRLGGVAFVVAVVAILLGGTLWIMSNLNTRTTPQQMHYMNQQTGI